MTRFQTRVGLATSALVGFGTLVAGTASEPQIDLTGTPSPYLFVFAGDSDKAESDFLAIIDARAGSATHGEPLTSLPIGMKASMPHHTEYAPPPSGEPIFMNAHHHELSLLVDTSNLPSLHIEKTFLPPPTLSFPHDYQRTSRGTRLVGFLRGENEPLDHGGVAEYAATGELLRTVSAADPTISKAIRPYAFVDLPDIDRFVVTSAPMMEDSWAEVLQIYRSSDFTLTKTLEFPAPPTSVTHTGWDAKATGFGPRALADGSVFISTFECALYHLTDIETDTPQLKFVHSIAPDQSAPAPHACGIPVRLDNFWIQPVGDSSRVVVFDITDPTHPIEVFRLQTPDDFKPHWLSKDPTSNRLILGAELGGEQGFYVLRIDEGTGALGFDTNFNGGKAGYFFNTKTAGYISLKRSDWPHGSTGNAWGHAALFLSGSNTP